MNKIVVLDLTHETHGNANGVGTADFTTKRLVDKTNWPVTYAYGLMSTVVAPTKMATVLNTDRDVLKAAVKTRNILDCTRCRMVRIRDTLHLGEIWIYEEMISDAQKHPDVEFVGELQDFPFDEQGLLSELA